MEPEEPILDPIASLSFLAARTHTIRLGTGVIILPQRNPLILAKELASLDVLSRGRLIFGLGAGYLEPEMNALGIPLEHRGSRADEYVAAMVALWTQPKPAFQGTYVAFGNVQAYPHPAQKPHPPIVIGGRTPAAHRRAVRYGDGWYGFNLGLEETRQQLAGLRKAAALHARGEGLGGLEISVTPPETVSRSDILQYAEMGVHRLILRLPRHDPPAQILSFVRSTAERLIGAV